MRDQTIPHHSGMSMTAPIGPIDRRFGLSPIEIKNSFINNLKCPVIIGLRSGLNFTLPQRFELTSDLLVFRTEITIFHNAMDDIQRVLSTVNEKSTKELKLLKEAFSHQLGKKHLNNSAVLMIDHTLSYAELEALGGTIYYEQLDLIVSLNHISNAPVHPYSQEGILDRLNKETETIDGFNLTIEIVDNQNKFGPRYINIGSKTYKIKTIKNSERLDGVYVVGNNNITNDNMLDIIESKFFPMEDAETVLGLARTYEEANNLINNIVDQRKQYISELEYNETMQKIEAQNTRHTQELIELERQKEVQVLTREREKHSEELKQIREKFDHELKMSREQVKDHFENRSYVRKDESEMLKMLPAVIIGIGAVVMAVKALS